MAAEKAAAEAAALAASSQAEALKLLEERCATLSKEKSELASALDAEQKLTEQLRRETNRLKAQNQTLEEKCAELTSTVTRQEANISELTTRKEKLEADLKAERVENESLRSKLNKSETECKSLQNQLINSQEEVNATTCILF